MTKNGLDAGVFQDTFNFFNSIVNIIEFYDSPPLIIGLRF